MDPIPYRCAPGSRVTGRQGDPRLRGDDKMVAGMTSRGNRSIMKHGVYSLFQTVFLFQNETKWAFFASY